MMRRKRRFLTFSFLALIFFGCFIHRKLYRLYYVYDDVTALYYKYERATELYPALLEGSRSNIYETVPSDSAFVNVNKSCSDFINRRQYWFHDVSHTEASFPLAFAITMYNDVAFAERLLKTIYRPHNHICIHVDLSAPDDVWHAITSVVSCLPNVFMTSQRYDVKWGTFSVLQADLICMKELLLRKGWKYFINLNGHEMPLKSNLELVEILTAYDGANDIPADRKDAEIRHKKWTSQSWIDFDHPTGKSKSPAPHNLVLSKGEAHIIASRDFVYYAIHSHIANEFLDWVKDVRVPDEYFFQTLNSNPHLNIPGSFNGSSANISQTRHKQWMYQRANRGTCGGHVVRNICNYGVRDLDKLTHTTKLFANKFTDTDGFTAQGCLEYWISLKIHKHITDVNITFYANLPFVVKANRNK